ncbi:MAG TPA: MFS transporter [Micrococcales bacterium]|uniref:MFS transporter n=1 Tax=Miniimonas arenae TaxID=676201 RepID=UPI000EC1EB45|nr:MFS transporter [Miniimonas arenae]HCX84457.1 MFS transporter [Micrococcales bacterium]
MFRPYREVLSKPGAWKFSLAGLFARLPISMVGIGIVLMLSDQRLYGSYGLAGQVSGVFVVAQAVAAPQIAKLIDRYGQARVMRPAIAISMTALAALALAANAMAPVPVLLVLAVVVGASLGSMGSLVRTRWNAVTDTHDEMHTAYALESVLDEVVFVVGPVLATVLATGVHPAAGLAVAIVAAVLGGYAFLAQRATEPPPSGRVDAASAGSRQSLLRNRRMLVLVVVFVCMGTIFGATDVSTVAFAEESGYKGLSGVILACFAAGSLVGGFVYGARRWSSPLWRRFSIGTVVLAVGVSLFFLTTSLVMLAGVMVVVGLSIAPTLVSGNSLVQEIVPGTRLTEGLTWVGTALGVGVAAGSAIAGPLIDAHGSHTGFLVSTGAGVVAVVVTLGAGWTMRARRNADAPFGVDAHGHPTS